MEVVLVDDGRRTTPPPSRAARVRASSSSARAPAAAIRRWRGTAAPWPPQAIPRLPRCGLSPAPGWLARILAGHAAGAAVVGGSLDLPTGLPTMARCDYYCGWYHVHSRRPAGEVPNHPPGNLSVRRADSSAPGLHRAAADRVRARGAGLAGGGSPERRHDPVRSCGDRPPLQSARVSATCSAATTAGDTAPSRARRRPARPVRRGCTAIPPCWSPRASRSRSGAPPTSWCWVRAGMLEPLLMLPAVLAARLAYSAGLVAGGIRWMRFGADAAEARPRWE